MGPILNLHMCDQAQPLLFGLCLLKMHNYFVSTDSISSVSSVDCTAVGLVLPSTLDDSISSLAGWFLITTHKAPLIPSLVPPAWSLLLSDHCECGSWSKLTYRTSECLNSLPHSESQSNQSVHIGSRVQSLKDSKDSWQLVDLNKPL